MPFNSAAQQFNTLLPNAVFVAPERLRQLLSTMLAVDLEIFAFIEPRLIAQLWIEVKRQAWIDLLRLNVDDPEEISLPRVGQSIEEDDRNIVVTIDLAERINGEYPVLSVDDLQRLQAMLALRTRVGEQQFIGSVLLTDKKCILLRQGVILTMATSRSFRLQNVDQNCRRKPARMN
ncbi:hypothetical protein XY58_17540 [Stenotrophomonas maltophilia]|nr:hypothetical protein XY58_17540 [Stenotrophomonas maltophilia]MBA0254344.1 hypothetical protein [Stenotrophomonas maltophilia]MBA0451232.1 hypothetical protein [Stenotrophomonas maltophilia]MBA0481810.1 hypothetical protein [Stenotrophomonas maltophilia]MBA0490377.1 hypothetical protein [Stenotrophomonas maltophilia]